MAKLSKPRIKHEMQEINAFIYIYVFNFSVSFLFQREISSMPCILPCIKIYGSTAHTNVDVYMK